MEDTRFVLVKIQMKMIQMEMETPALAELTALQEGMASGGGDAGLTGVRRGGRGREGGPVR